FQSLFFGANPLSTKQILEESYVKLEGSVDSKVSNPKEKDGWWSQLKAGIKDGAEEAVKGMTTDVLAGMKEHITHLWNHPNVTLKKDWETFAAFGRVISLPDPESSESVKFHNQVNKKIVDGIKGDFQKNVTNGTMYTGSKYFAGLTINTASFFAGPGELKGIEGIGKEAKLANEAGEIAKITSKVEKAGTEGAKDGGKILKKTEDAEKGIEGGSKTTSLLDELANSGVKYNADDVVSVTKTADGKLVWLENGNSNAGLQHIMEHAEQFATKGISKDKISDFVMYALENGEVVGTQRTRTIYEVMYGGKLQRVAISVGDNGFIVGANPKSIPK
ncbi:MAG: hypothetical protein ACE5RF_09310, partial [Nitrosarchaeum sp.]